MSSTRHTVYLGDEAEDAIDLIDESGTISRSKIINLALLYTLGSLIPSDEVAVSDALRAYHELRRIWEGTDDE